MATRRLGIIVGGGPAPGINGVINAAAIEAINRGYEVIGFYDGFRWLASDRFDPARNTVRLDIPLVARIHFDGGSILRTSRTSLLDDARLKSHKMVAPDPEKVGRVLANLRQLGIDNLLTIGGDDTALSARFVVDSAEQTIRVVHVPKTIDNDLPLPADVPTFGFSTARLIGTELVKNLMRDSQTTGRWYLAETMGRSAGWLALSIGMAAGATLTLIPEEFPSHTKVSDVLDIIEGAILKRRTMGRPDGIAIVAEGLTYKLGDREELEIMLGREIPLDAAGHMRLSEVNLAILLKNQIQERFKRRGQTIELVDHELGYELRSADPTPFDMGYCRMLGYFSIQLLREGKQSAVMVSIAHGNLHPIEFHDMIDPATNRTRTRVVDLKSDVYRAARAYMIRLEPSDFANAESLAKLAAEAKMSTDEFRAKFEGAAGRAV
jgi:6-phosphofructokinase 1